MNSTGNTIQTLEWFEHIRLNPEMYIGRIGDGSDVKDGIYTLLKGLIDSSADEFEMGYAKRLEIEFPNSYYRLEIVKDILEQYSAKHKGFPISLNGY